MATLCPNGHLSETDDYCDQCGAKMGDPTASAPAPSAPAPATAAAPSAATVPCPSCGAPNNPGDKFCEVCGYDMSLPAPPLPTPAAPPLPTPAAPPAPAPATPPAPAPGAWSAVAQADRDYFERLQAGDIAFPAVYPDRVFALSSERAVIGRRSASRGINPEVDLSGAPEDPGVSHMQAVLVATADGGWTIIDPGSANGTFINESTDPIPTNQPVAVGAGDRIHIGAWTTLTLRKA
jgi:hypothetical protein